MNGQEKIGRYSSRRDEVKAICKVLHCSSEVACIRLDKYKHLPSHERIQEVLNNSFCACAAKVSIKTLLAEGQFIKQIFPTKSLGAIVQLLRDFAHESNRVQIILKLLLLKSKPETLKRKHTAAVPHTQEKKSKLSMDMTKLCTSTSVPSSSDSNGVDEEFYIGNDNTVNLNVNESPPPSSISIERVTYPSLTELTLESHIDNSISDGSADTSQSQLVQTDSQSTIIDTSERENYDCYVSLDQTASLETDFQATDITRPETSENCDLKVVEKSINEMNSMIVPIEDMPQGGEKINNELLDGPGCSGLNIPTLATCSSFTSDLSELVPHNDVEDFDFYKYLEEMFSMVPQIQIREMCNKYGVKQYTKPSTEIFNAIVSELLGNNLEDDLSSNNDNAVLRRIMSKRKCKMSMPSTSRCCTTTLSTLNAKTPDPPVTEEIEGTISAFEDQLNELSDFIANAREISARNIEKALSEQVKHEWDNDEEEPEIINNEDDKSCDSLVYRLIEMFPQACPGYIRKICHGKQNDPNIFDELVSEILESDYPKRIKMDSPKRVLSFDEQMEMMVQIFPDADPNYLRIHCERLFDQADELKAFITNMLEKRQYPTMKDYLRKQQLSAQQKQYTSDFSIQKFLEVIPDPVAYFSDKNRKAATMDVDGFHYAVCFLRNRYPKIPVNTIRTLFKKSNSNFLKTCEMLDNIDPTACLRSKRALLRMPEPPQDIPLLQEIAYIEHYHEIIKYIKDKQLLEKVERDTAKENDQLKTCCCCYDEEVMPKDIFICEEGCMFCKECVKKGAEVTFGNGKLQFSCLSDCTSYFSLQTLQAVLNPKMFSVIALKKQLEEVKAAGIEDLEMCPFCDFANIPARGDKLFRCLNPECMKESCRSCKEPSHVPLRCDEVEKEEDVRTRTYIENKMTEALIRKCYKCGMKFIKADGCNKMTCSCGAMMCYICGKPVQDYKHFNGVGGDKYHLCPLYSDTNKLHEQAVLQGATKAKKEIGVDHDPTKLKHDPTVDIKKYYKEQAKNGGAVPQQHPNEFFNVNYGRLFVLHQQPNFNHLNVYPPQEQDNANVQLRQRNEHLPLPHVRYRHHRHHHHHRDI